MAAISKATPFLLLYSTDTPNTVMMAGGQSPYKLHETQNAYAIDVENFIACSPSSRSYVSGPMNKNNTVLSPLFRVDYIYCESEPVPAMGIHHISLPPGLGVQGTIATHPSSNITFLLTGPIHNQLSTNPLWENRVLVYACNMLDGELTKEPVWDMGNYRYVDSAFDAPNSLIYAAVSNGSQHSDYGGQMLVKKPVILNNSSSSVGSNASVIAALGQGRFMRVYFVQNKLFAVVQNNSYVHNTRFFSLVQYDTGNGHLLGSFDILQIFPLEEVLLQSPYFFDEAEHMLYLIFSFSNKTSSFMSAVALDIGSMNVESRVTFPVISTAIPLSIWMDRNSTFLAVAVDQVVHDGLSSVNVDFVARFQRGCKTCNWNRLADNFWRQGEGRMTAACFFPEATVVGMVSGDPSPRTICPVATLPLENDLPQQIFEPLPRPDPFVEITAMVVGVIRTIYPHLFADPIAKVVVNPTTDFLFDGNATCEEEISSNFGKYWSNQFSNISCYAGLTENITSFVNETLAESFVTLDTLVNRLAHIAMNEASGQAADWTKQFFGDASLHCIQNVSIRIRQIFAAQFHLEGGNSKELRKNVTILLQSIFGTSHCAGSFLASLKAVSEGVTAAWQLAHEVGILLQNLQSNADFMGDIQGILSGSVPWANEYLDSMHPYDLQWILSYAEPFFSYGQGQSQSEKIYAELFVGNMTELFDAVRSMW
jgi:hypothetical protein